MTSGPRLLLNITLSIICLCTWIVLTNDGGLVDKASETARWTARTSFLMFVFAYVARPGVQLWRNAFTKNLLAERKWIGLGFAVSHLAHLIAIVALASPDFGAFVAAQSPVTLAATFTFAVLFAMAITSIDAVRKKMPPRAWKLLHRTGMHLSWISFTGTYAVAIGKSPAYAVPTLILVAVGAVRLAAWIRARAQRALVE